MYPLRSFMFFLNCFFFKSLLLEFCFVWHGKFFEFKEIGRVARLLVFGLNKLLWIEISYVNKFHLLKVIFIRSMKFFFNMTPDIILLYVLDIVSNKVYETNWKIKCHLVVIYYLISTKVTCSTTKYRISASM